MLTTSTPFFIIFHCKPPNRLMSSNILSFSFNPCPTQAEFQQAWTASLEQAQLQLEFLEKPLNHEEAKQYLQSLDKVDAICSRFDLQGRTWDKYHPDASMRDESVRARDAFAAVLASIESSSAIAENVAKVEASGLISDPDGVRLLCKWKQTLAREGAYLPAEKKARVQHLTVAIQAKANEYSRNIQNDSTTLDFTWCELRGLPLEYLDERADGSVNGAVRAYRKALDIEPILEFCELQPTREKAYRHLYNKGGPENEKVLSELLVLRQEKAELLGYPNWAAYEMGPGLINNVKDAQDFLQETRQVIDNAADVELLHLQKYMAGRHVDKLQLWDLAYVQNLLKSELLDGFDPKSTRQYFQVDKVLPGLRSIVESMFSLRFEKMLDCEAWHPTISVFQVYDTTCREEKLLGRIFFDLFSRQGKQDGYWGTTICKPIMNSQLGEVIVVSSLSNAPGACMSFDQVKDGFRVFGHCVHVLLSANQYARFSGLTHIEHDFAGTSSQLLGHWMRYPQLFDFATNKNGERIPKGDMVNLFKAGDIGQATLRRRWMIDCQVSVCRLSTLTVALILAFIV
ncbi:hypothetical protein QFC22_005867 [Naganishia vaughanmartiniae]|uniref:Uncharacterized protein n=1 Tax=Naganishia vaughanmartiniae TaxID=1424756 RepID=A0ACC2WU43_9TREE|nr:hypothetical protein QFC22_005867 [Naganishia vaughanmartiniae]